MGLIQDEGALALSSRLKLLSERWYDQVDAAYREHGSALQSRWFPLLRALQVQGPSTIGALARGLGLTHPAVSQLANRLVRDGWLLTAPGADRRERRLALSDKAEAELLKARPIWAAMRAGVEARLAATGVDVLAVLAQLERGLDEDPFPADVARRYREASAGSAAVRLVPWSPDLQPHFYRLNAEWLSKYYRIEPFDHEVLSNPQKHIVDPGGTILFAMLGDEVVGTCALMLDAPGVYELTKMAVTEAHQGLGLGRRLIDAAIDEFRRRGAQTLFLETNGKLQTAIAMYRKVGFEQQPGVKPGSHYARADIYMIWRDPAGEATR